MIEPEELLQRRVEQLEAGESLDASLAGLPESEARTLRLIAGLRAATFPETDEKLAAAQRASLLQAARENPMKPTPDTDVEKQGALSWLDRVRAQLDWLFTRPELATALISLLLILFLLAAAAGLWQWRDDRETRLADPGEVPAVVDTATTPAANEIVVADPVVTDAIGDVGPGSQLYLPLTSSPLVVNAQTAVLEEIRGVVEIQTGDDTWTTVTAVTTLTGGQRLRTAALSSATLTFFDGSQTHLGPETELSIDQLDAQRPEDGFRTVVLTQWVGESEHSVDFRNDQGSRYEVRTPGGDSVARGTRFRVRVAPNLLAHFSVSEGRVDVSNLNVTVPVTAGQATMTMAGRTPEEPTFRLSGEGEVSQTGSVWTIAGQTFQTHQNSIIIGNPQVGDLVYVEGRLLSDGGRVADLIILLRRAVNNRFQLTGEVEAIGPTTWTVAGQTILIDNDTRIDYDITVGDTVRVAGVILPGGGLQARSIRLLDVPGFPFSFAGVVQARGSETWRISDQLISVADDTIIGDDLDVGDVVSVQGRILADGRWLAQRIERLVDPERNFELTGLVQSVDPWQVASIGFEVRAWTVIEPGITTGDRVRVQGVILPDGTLVATRIDRRDDQERIIVIIGIVGSLNPLVINGILLGDGNDNQNGAWLIGDIEVNMLVEVTIRIRADGRWVIVRVRPIQTSFGLGCLIVNTVVVNVTAGQINLRHWPAIPLSDGVNVMGEVQANSVVMFPICTLYNNTVIIVNITVIHQPVVIIAPPQPPRPPRGNQNFNG